VSGPVRLPRGVRSIFGRLLVIMVAMAVCLLLAVSVFFFAFVNPAVNRSLGRMHGELARAQAALAPDFAQARAFADRTGVDVAYDGPRGRWTTTRRPVDVWALREERLQTFIGSREVALVDTADGGRYAFFWSFGPRMDTAHNLLLLSLLLIMVAVLTLAHLVLRRLLEPIRALSEGVQRIGEGRFETLAPRPARDELGALTSAFNHMVGRVREMMRARDQLLLDVSHELRSPLTRLKVALALLPPGEPRARMDADVAEMEAMVGELLELERLRNGHGVRRAETDLGALVADVARGFAGQAPGVEVAPHPCVVAPVDAARLRTVIRNLVENAVKYSLPDSRPVRIVLDRADRDVTLRVEDDGAGIPDGDLAQVFVPFFRVDRSRSKKTGGYGLGLSICQRIAEAHGGAIAVAPRSPRGTVFTVTLPA
jgi:signal transduction histidine kinase